jgi:hypothetical protein
VKKPRRPEATLLLSTRLHTADPLVPLVPAAPVAPTGPAGPFRVICNSLSPETLRLYLGVSLMVIVLAIIRC